MRHVLPLAALVLFAVAVPGCASSGTARAGGPRHSAYVISGDEIADAQGVVTVYDAIQRLRPQWLTNSRARNIGTQDQLIVYLDTNRYGTLESLRQMPIGGVTDIKYLNATEATNRYGTGHSGGAIVIMMSRQ
jgi:hypothetical protein